MKVSIIVPVYNAEKYLEKSLNSLVSQSLPDIEIICVNDGSTDSSLEILERFANIDERIVVVTQPNQGQSVARNVGLRLAKGEYVGFLDADDWVEPDAFEKLYTKANGSDISICSIKVCADGSEKLDDTYLSLRVFPKNLDNKVFTHKDCADFLFRISVTPWNKIYKRQFLNDFGIRFVDNVNFEDNIFFLETFLNAKSIVLIRESLVCYRVDSLTSYSHNGDDKKKLDFFKVVDAQAKVISKFPEYKKAFLFHKKFVLSYWLKKIKTPSVRVWYWWLLFFRYPMILFSPILKPLKTKLKLLLLPKDVLFWCEEGGERFFAELGVSNQLVTPKTLFKIPSEVKIVVLTSSYYNYCTYVERLIRERGYRNEVLECVLPLW